MEADYRGLNHKPNYKQTVFQAPKAISINSKVICQMKGSAVQANMPGKRVVLNDIKTNRIKCIPKERHMNI